MKKKLLAVLMAATMVSSLVACGGAAETPAQADTQTAETQTTEATADAAPAETAEATEAATEAAARTGRTEAEQRQMRGAPR